MSRKAKNTRTQIADLPEGVSVMSAEAMANVAGGAIRGASAQFGFGFGRAALGATATTPASMTEPGQVDTATDEDR
jgi:hypothetical protein